MLIREELRVLEDQDHDLICSITREMGLYSYSAPSTPSHADAVSRRLLQLRKHGLVFPYVCSGCTALNESYPSVCQFDECGAPNET